MSARLKITCNQLIYGENKKLGINSLNIDDVSEKGSDLSNFVFVTHFAN